MICPKCSRPAQTAHPARTCLHCGAVLPARPAARLGLTALQWRKEGARVAQRRQFERALAAFEHALELEPENGLAWLNKAMALRELGRPDEATAAIRSAAELAPDDENVRRALRMDRGAGVATLAPARDAAATDDSPGRHRDE